MSYIDEERLKRLVAEQLRRGPASAAPGMTPGMAPGSTNPYGLSPDQQQARRANISGPEGRIAMQQEAAKQLMGTPMPKGFQGVGPSNLFVADIGGTLSAAGQRAMGAYKQNKAMREDKRLDKARQAKIDAELARQDKMYEDEMKIAERAANKSDSQDELSTSEFYKQAEQVREFGADVTTMQNALDEVYGLLSPYREAGVDFDDIPGVGRISGKEGIAGWGARRWEELRGGNPDEIYRAVRAIASIKLREGAGLSQTQNEIERLRPVFEGEKLADPKVLLNALESIEKAMIRDIAGVKGSKHSSVIEHYNQQYLRDDLISPLSFKPHDWRFSSKKDKQPAPATSAVPSTRGGPPVPLPEKADVAPARPADQSLSKQQQILEMLEKGQIEGMTESAIRGLGLTPAQEEELRRILGR